jgi:hypothetical protein
MIRDCLWNVEMFLWAERCFTNRFKPFTFLPLERPQSSMHRLLGLAESYLYYIATAENLLLESR